MFIKRWLGVVLLFVGLGLSFASKTMTGAVIGFSPLNLLGFFGILVFIAGIFLLYSSNLEEITEGIEDKMTPWQKEKFKGLKYEERKAYEKSYQSHFKKIGKKADEKKKEVEYPSSIGEAVEQGKLKSYLAGKRIIFDTSLLGGTYDKHTKFIGRGIELAEFLKKVGREAQYSPEHSLNNIHRFEEYVARKGNGYSIDAHKARLYGRAHSSHGGPPGAFDSKFTGWIAVELQERPDGIHIHGYPVPQNQVPNKYRHK